MEVEEIREEKDLKPSLSGEVLFPSETKYGDIKNKDVRNRQYHKARKEKRKEKKKLRKEREREGVKKLPHTIESLREKDETTVGDLTTEENAPIRADLENDEFSAYYQATYEPKVLLTFADNPHKKTRIFGKELLRIIPNTTLFHRSRSGVKKIVRGAKLKGFTDVVIINEDRKEPNGLLVIHLPDGPTAYFKLSNVKITTDMRRSHRDITKHRPEVILNNFSTRLGLTIGRMLGSLFHYSPEFKGQRAVAFHNQRDYIFFRHYKYDFDDEGKRAKLRELGPRFTLRLRYLQKGTFDTKYGQYEWIIEGRRHVLEASRRRFHL